jgi:hypothetical protein
MSNTLDRSQLKLDRMPDIAGDPIVESGSNADGEWTRWADGSQEQSGSVIPTAVTGIITLPNTSVSRPTFIGLTVYEADNVGASAARLETSLSSVSFGYRTLDAAGSAQAGEVFFVAMSQWK